MKSLINRHLKFILIVMSLLILIPCTGLSNPDSTKNVKPKKTLKPTMFQNKGKTYFAFDSDQSKYIIKSIKQNQINQFNLKLKDSIIYNVQKQNTNLNLQNTLLSKGIDTCNNLNLRLGNELNNKQSKINRLNKKISNKNIFIVGSLSVNIAILTILGLKFL